MDTAALSNIALLVVTVLGMYTAAFWLALVIWVYRDHRARSRDGLASIAAALLVAVLFLPGLLVYLLLRPRETLAEAYERSLEEEALLQDIEEKPMCPGCGRPTHADWQVCPHCHTTLKRPCLKCNRLLDLVWTQCPYCATPQSAYAAPEGAPSAGGRSGHVRPRATAAGSTPASTQAAPAAKPTDFPAQPPAQTLEYIDDDAYRV